MPTTKLECCGLDFDSGTTTEYSSVSGSIPVITFQLNIAGFVKHQNGISWPLGVPFYWDPINGNDSNNGLTAEEAKLTFAATLALCTAYNHDSISVLNTTEVALVFDIKVDVNVAKVHLIGDGNTTLKPTSSGAATVILSAIGVHLEGLRIEGLFWQVR